MAAKQRASNYRLTWVFSGSDGRLVSREIHVHVDVDRRRLAVKPGGLVFPFPQRIHRCLPKQHGTGSDLHVRNRSGRID